MEIDDLLARGARGPTGRPVTFLLDGKGAEFALHSPFFDRGRLLRSFGGSGILFSEGALWKERRRIIQPSFPSREPDHHLQDVVWAMPGLVSRFTAAADSGEPFNVVEETVRFTIRVLYRGVFGQELPPDHDRVGVILDFFDSVGGVLASTIFPALRLDGRTMAEVRRAGEAIDGEVARLVAVRRGASLEVDRIDALGQLIENLDAKGDSEGVHDEVRSLLLAGAETSSNTLSFVLLMLARHPEARERLERELEHEVTEESPYLEAVLLETLRLFPPIWFQTREALESVDFGDRHLEKDDLAFIATALIHRDPDIWEDPDEFRPERFLPGPDGPWRPPHRYAFFPFGGGRHLCIGRHLAMHELRLATRELVGRFRFEIDPEVEIAAEIGVVLKPARDIRLRVSKRPEARS